MMICSLSWSVGNRFPSEYKGNLSLLEKDIQLDAYVMILLFLISFWLLNACKTAVEEAGKWR